MDLKDLENIAILCKTKDEANRCCNLANKLGLKWIDGSSYVNTNKWYMYKKNTAYNFYDGTFCGIRSASRDNTIRLSEWFLDNFKINKDMEERNIKLSLTTAKEWYKGSDETLKKLALQAYKEEELKEVKTWEDLVNIKVYKYGYYINTNSEIKEEAKTFIDNDKNLFIDEKHAKSALAMAKISQLMPYYGGKITDEEWENGTCKWSIIRMMDRIDTIYSTFLNYFLSFHTPEQRDEFLKYNEILVRDYLMLD